MMMEYGSAIVGGLIWGLFTYHYAQWKVLIGPEEEDDENLRGLELVRDRIKRGERKALAAPGGIGILYIVANILLWILFLRMKGFNALFLMDAITASLLCSLSYVDIRMQELPPEENLLIGVIGLIHLFTDLPHWWEYLLGAVIVSGLFLIVGLLSKGGAMGLGDVKMMAALGLLLGWKGILLVMVLGCVFGTLIHLPAVLIFKKSRQFAFGPYLSAGAIAVMCCGTTILNWYLGLFEPAGL